jgi:cell cycle checkpoint protein
MRARASFLDFCLDYVHITYLCIYSFNPIASTLMKRALQNLLATHFSTLSSSTSAHPSKETLDLVVASANGDIRSAIMALQFACTSPSPELQGASGVGKKKKGTKKTKGGDARALMEAVTRREQSLALFHLVGKILYNKRMFGQHVHVLYLSPDAVCCCRQRRPACVIDI